MQRLRNFLNKIKGHWLTDLYYFGYDGQMIFGDLVGLKLPDISLTGEEKPQKNLTQETCPDQGSNLGPLRDKHACYHLFHSSGL